MLKWVYMKERVKIQILLYTVTLKHTTKIQNCPNLKQFAEFKKGVTQELEFALGRVENIVGKKENAGNQYFLRFPQYFERLFPWNSWYFGKELTLLQNATRLFDWTKTNPGQGCFTHAGISHACQWTFPGMCTVLLELSFLPWQLCGKI